MALPSITVRDVPAAGEIVVDAVFVDTFVPGDLFVYGVPDPGFIVIYGLEAAEGGGSINAAGSWTAGNDTWSGAAKETLTSTGAWTAGNDVWVGIGTPGTVVAATVIADPVALRPMIKLPPPQFGPQSAPVKFLGNLTRNLKGQ